MSTAAAANGGEVGAIEQALVCGDLSRLTPGQRVMHYQRVCESLGLNPHTQPFDYISLNGKLRLYAKKDATDQLRKLHGVQVVSVKHELAEGVYEVMVEVQDATGRRDLEIGAVSVAGLKGDALANAHMKALTKAKRRATLSICGLGWLDETELETIPEVEPATHPDFLARIEGAKSEQELADIANDIAAANLPAKPLAAVRACYKATLAKLKAPKALPAAPEEQAEREAIREQDKRYGPSQEELAS